MLPPVEVRFDDDLIRGIDANYNESPTRRGRPFRHYGKDLGTVRRMTAANLDENIFCIAVFFKSEMTGIAKLVTNEKRTYACLMHIVAMNRRCYTAAPTH